MDVHNKLNGLENTFIRSELIPQIDSPHHIVYIKDL